MTRAWRTPGPWLVLLVSGLLLGGLLLTRGSASEPAVQAPTEMPHGDDFSISCEECHDPEAWTPVKKVTFKHATTGFPLVGAHASARCRSCHQTLVFNHVGTACADCHQDAHRGELGPRCEDCHVPRTWTNQREMFAVHNRTRFPLLAAHATLDCQACHKGQRQTEYALTPVECEGCHLQTWNRTANPNHAAAGFGTHCEDCHARVSRDWTSITHFAHPATFPLRGGHAGVPCGACHVNGYAGLSRECDSCHEQDYLRTTNPNHAASHFPRRCDQCHTIDAWSPATFNHNLTRFPLTGAHVRVACASCHVGGRYTGTPTDCYACHRTDYQGTTNPNHVTGHFPTTCAVCHSTTAWSPASFNHNNTGFPLTGAHVNVSCARCHPNGRFAGTPKDCYSCHQTDYQNTTDPNHVAAGFPHDCTLCHNTSSWSGANFTQHDSLYFPIYSGTHQGRWSTCADCHVNPSNFHAFECINCHAHNRTDTDNAHSGVSGYVYASPNCYACHPRGTTGG